MTRRFTVLAWVAATATYLLIVLGAIVRITGSGMGCGDDWPLCNGHVFPPLDDLATVIEWGHRQAAVLVSVLVVALAAFAWWLRRSAVGDRPSAAPYWAVGLLVIQVLLGAITVKLELPHWTVVLHLATAMLLLAVLLLSAIGYRRSAADGRQPTANRPAVAALVLGFVTVLLGGMTAKMGAAGACTGFPLCNGQLWPDGGLPVLHWVHRLFAYGLTLHVIGWAIRSGRRTADGGGRASGPWVILGLISLQVVVAAGMVMAGLPPAMQALHVAVGTAVWGGLVIVATASRQGVYSSSTAAK